MTVTSFGLPSSSHYESRKEAAKLVCLPQFKDAEE
jgi:hypothetical protein